MADAFGGMFKFLKRLFLLFRKASQKFKFKRLNIFSRANMHAQRIIAELALDLTITYHFQHESVTFSVLCGRLRSRHVLRLSCSEHTEGRGFEREHVYGTW